MKSFNLVANDNSKKLLNQFKYFEQMETLGSYKTPEDKEDWLKTSTYVQAFKKAVVFITTKCAEKMVNAIAEHG